MHEISFRMVTHVSHLKVKAVQKQKTVATTFLHSNALEMKIDHHEPRIHPSFKRADAIAIKKSESPVGIIDMKKSH